MWGMIVAPEHGVWVGVLASLPSWQGRPEGVAATGLQGHTARWGCSGLSAEGGG